MTDAFVIRLSDRWAILADRNQWVLAKLEKNRSQADLKHPSVRWRGVSFTGSTKTVLKRVVSEKRINVSSTALDIIEGWPDRFLDWRACWISKDSGSRT